MLYRIKKGAVGIAHIALLLLFALTLSGKMPWSVETGSMIVSAGWLLLTVVRLPRLLRSFEDHFARMQVLVPGFFGLGTAIAALVLSRGLAPVMVALAELLGWGAVYSSYDLRSRGFIVQGHGPLPDDTWMSPELDALQEGDLILTDGRMAARSHNSIGHVELIIKGRDGKLMAFSSYMEKGVVMHTLRALIALEKRSKQHYIVLRLKTPFTAEQSARAIEIAEEMLASNDAWRKAATERRTRMVGKLPLPELWRKWLLAKVLPTGYDWWGQYSGFIHEERWTCMGACLEVLNRLGVKTRHYGTGLLGLGTGLLNPLMPIRLVREPAYRLLRTADKDQFELAKSSSSGAKEKA